MKGNKHYVTDFHDYNPKYVVIYRIVGADSLQSDLFCMNRNQKKKVHKLYVEFISYTGFCNLRLGILCITIYFYHRSFNNNYKTIFFLKTVHTELYTNCKYLSILDIDLNTSDQLRNIYYKTL